MVQTFTLSPLKGTTMFTSTAWSYAMIQNADMFLQGYVSEAEFIVAHNVIMAAFTEFDSI